MNKQNKGFTLAEIITVVALLAVLSVVGVVIFNNLQEQVRRTVARSDAATMARQFNTVNSLTESPIEGPLAAGAITENIVLIGIEPGITPDGFRRPGPIFINLNVTYDSDNALVQEFLYWNTANLSWTVTDLNAGTGGTPSPTP